MFGNKVMVTKEGIITKGNFTLAVYLPEIKVLLLLLVDKQQTEQSLIKSTYKYHIHVLLSTNCHFSYQDIQLPSFIFA